jgi:hypothetical protein
VVYLDKLHFSIFPVISKLEAILKSVGYSYLGNLTSEDFLNVESFLIINLEGIQNVMIDL